MLAGEIAVFALQTHRSIARFDLGKGRLFPIGMIIRDLYSSPGSEELRRQSCAGACGRSVQIFALRKIRHACFIAMMNPPSFVLQSISL